MSSMKPFILDELPELLVGSGLYFISNPLDTSRMSIYVASSDGSTAKCIYTASPMSSMEPSLYDSVSVTYESGDIASKKFLLSGTEIAELTFQYTGGEITSKKLFIGGTFVCKITFTYTSGVYTGSTYSTVE